MKTKTVHLCDDYRIRNGEVEVFTYIRSDREPDKYSDDGYRDAPVYGWVPTKYKIGERVMLVSHTNVSPNAIMEGRDVATYSLVFDSEDGIGGNSNPDITRYHGWRGTTNNVSCYAHGLREIIKIRELKNGTIAVTVGNDLAKGEK